MRKLTILSLFLCLTLSLLAQENRTHRNYTITTEKDATYPGGQEAMYKFLSDNTQYPLEAKEKNIEGDVYVSFDVLATGATDNIEIIKDPGAGLGEEAKRLVSLLKFEPAVQGGRNIKMNMMMPVLFRL